MILLGIPKMNPATGISTDQNAKRIRKNRPGQKFGAKKKSWVWSWFIQDTTNHNMASCEVCGKIVTRLESDKGSPKKLSEHLKTHKIDKESINTGRQIPVDGNGVPYDLEPKLMTGQASRPKVESHISHQQTPHPSRSQQPNGGYSQGPTQTHSSYGQGMVPQQGMGNQFQNQLQSQYPTHQQPHQQSHQQVHPGVNGPGVAPLNHSGAGFNDFRSGSISNDVATHNQYSNNNNRRYLSSEFDNSPYNSLKFHKHLMAFLKENKLSINVIKSSSFQQLVYDLRSDSILELMELINVYNSLLEVSRFENPSMASMEESSMVNSIAQAVNQKLSEPGN